MSPVIAATLSLIPGAGHLYIGKRRKAVALFVLDIGIAGAFLVLKTNIGYLLIALGYLMTMVPAVLETYALARGKVSGFSESKPYIWVMLLMEGFAALPLLWQSQAFSKRTKIAWSIAVPLLAVLYFVFLGLFGIRFLNNAKF